MEAAGIEPACRNVSVFISARVYLQNFSALDFFAPLAERPSEVQQNF